MSFPIKIEVEADGTVTRGPLSEYKGDDEQDPTTEEKDK